MTRPPRDAAGGGDALGKVFDVVYRCLSRDPQKRPTFDAIVSDLAAAAAVTQTIKIGTGICLVIQRDPIQTAKEVATLDYISDGRVLFGVGAGWNAEEIADHGTAFKSRFRLMEERVEAMKTIWTMQNARTSGNVSLNLRTAYFRSSSSLEKRSGAVRSGGGATSACTATCVLRRVSSRG